MYEEKDKPVVTQLLSRHFLKDGNYYIEYSFKVEGFFYFTDLSSLWEKAFDTKIVNLSEKQNIASYYEERSNRAIKYSKDDLDLIFKDLIVFGQARYKAGLTPEKYKVEGY